MSHRVTFIIREDLDPSTVLDSVQQMLDEQLERYDLSGCFHTDDVMVTAHPEDAPVDHVTEEDLDAMREEDAMRIAGGAAAQRERNTDEIRFAVVARLERMIHAMGLTDQQRRHAVDASTCPESKDPTWSHLNDGKG